MLRVNIGLNRTLVGLAGAAVGILLLSSLRSVIFELLVALGIAYILDPLVDRLERLVRSRGLAILLMLVPLLGVLALLFAWLVPRLVEEIGDFIRELPRMLEIPFVWASNLLMEQFNLAVPATLEELVNRFGADIRSAAPQVFAALKATLGGLFTGGYGVFRLITASLLVPIFAVYLLYDFDRIVAYLRMLVPRVYEPVVVRHVQEIDRAVAGFFRGQLTVCLILGSLYSLGYTLVGVKLALVIGLGTGLMAIIPYLGALIGFVTALTFSLVALASGSGSGWQVLGTVIVFASVQAMDAVFITPRVLGKSVNLSPIFVLIALLVGGTLLGFVGVLIAVPTAASLRVVAHSLVQWYRSTQFYQHGFAEATLAPATAVPVARSLPVSVPAPAPPAEAPVPDSAGPPPEEPTAARAAGGQPPEPAEPG